MVMGAALLRAWGAPALVTRVEIDAAGAAGGVAENTDVTGLAADRAAASRGRSSTGRCRCRSPSTTPRWTWPKRRGRHPGASTSSRSASPASPPGRYDLKIDGQAIGTFTEAELAKGVNLARLQHADALAGLLDQLVRRGDGHEMQRLRREMLVDAPSDPTGEGDGRSPRRARRGGAARPRRGGAAAGPEVRARSDPEHGPLAASVLETT